MTQRFRITAPLTRRERLLDYALGVALAVLVVAMVAGVVALALLGMAK
jgi:hypothetical protein